MENEYNTDYTEQNNNVNNQTTGEGGYNTGSSPYTTQGSPYTAGSTTYTDATGTHTAESTGYSTNGTYSTGSSPYTSSQSGQNGYYTHQFGGKAKTVKEKSPKRFGAGFVAICVVLSLLCGLAGGFIGTKVFGSSSTPAITEAGEHTTVSTTIESYADLVDKTADCVVEITTEEVTSNSIFGQYVTSGAGSGVIIRSDGYIVTNNHVTSGASNITVTLHNGETYTATLVGSDSKTDLAVIKIDADNLTTAVFGSSDDVRVGDSVIAIGNPLGSLGGSVTNGIVSALEREIEISGQKMTLLQTSAAVNPGNSGGGLFNAYGELIGIVNAKPSNTSVSSESTTIDGIAFAIPVDTVKEVATSIIENGYVTGRVVMGISVVQVSDKQTAMQYNVSRTGVYIVSVVSGGGAEKAGLEVGDCILSVDGSLVEETSDVTSALDGKSVGDTVEVQVIRDNRMLEFTVELTEYTPTSDAA